MTHASTQPPRLRDRAMAQLWGRVEWFALAILPRGPLRKRVIARVDRELSHNRQSRPEALKRLKRAESQLRSVGEMIQAGRSFLDVAQQLHETERALREAKKMFINGYLDHRLNLVDSKSPQVRASVEEFKTIAKYL
jgi:uncharacterized protein